MIGKGWSFKRITTVSYTHLDVYKRQVLTNLLVNAIRHSPEQSRVEVSLEAKENGLFFYVKDQGKGIEERYLTRIFDRYFQVPGNLKEGTGCLLYTSRCV